MQHSEPIIIASAKTRANKPNDLCCWTSALPGPSTQHKAHADLQSAESAAAHWHLITPTPLHLT